MSTAGGHRVPRPGRARTSLAYPGPAGVSTTSRAILALIGMTLVVDVVEIALLPDPERAARMGALFQTLMTQSREQQIAEMRELIRTMAEKASDEAYVALCRTNLTLAAQLPEDVRAGFLAIRGQAVQSLPQDLQKRDQALLMKAFESLPEAIQSPLQRAMG